MHTLRLALTCGEPAGIGADLIVKAAQQPWHCEWVVFGDAQLLHDRAQRLQLPLKTQPVDFNQPPTVHQPGVIRVANIALKAPSHPGRLNTTNANYVLETLRHATNACLQKHCAALVTAPLHKAVINDAGIAFTGHTEFLAQHTQTDHVVMMLTCSTLRVALATTHLPLSEVSRHIQPHSLETTLRILQHDLCSRFMIKKPRIYVCGLNPHAGESGHLGREEIDVIIPVIEKLKSEGFELIGPLPADTLFTPQYLNHADAVLAMYHDQGLPVLKNMGFGQAVNITLGLPIIRTSVDHGTALDLAGTGRADASSLLAAMRMAIDLAHHAVP